MFSKAPLRRRCGNRQFLTLISVVKGISGDDEATVTTTYQHHVLAMTTAALAFAGSGQAYNHDAFVSTTWEARAESTGHMSSGTSAPNHTQPHQTKTLTTLCA